MGAGPPAEGEVRLRRTTAEAQAERKPTSNDVYRRIKFLRRWPCKGRGQAEATMWAVADTVMRPRW